MFPGGASALGLLKGLPLGLPPSPLRACYPRTATAPINAHVADCSDVLTAGASPAVMTAGQHDMPLFAALLAAVP